MSRVGSPPVPPHVAATTCGATTYRFFHGDCVDVVAALPPASYDVVVTSPPYHLGIAYRSYDDRVPRDRFLAWTGEWVSAVRRQARIDRSA